MMIIFFVAPSAFSESWEAGDGDLAYFVLKEAGSNKCIIGTYYINKISDGVANVTGVDKDGNKTETKNISVKQLNEACVKWYAEALKRKDSCEARK